jgi:hypothetical protein
MTALMSETHVDLLIRSCITSHSFVIAGHNRHASEYIGPDDLVRVQTINEAIAIRSYGWNAAQQSTREDNDICINNDPG